MRISISKLALIALLLGGSGYAVAHYRGRQSSDEKSRIITQLEKENEELSREIADKQSYLDRIQQNPDELELEIKRRLMLVNPGSKSFVLQDGKSDTAAQQPENR